MKKVIKSEICKERPNAIVVGAFNRALKIIKNGNNGGETLKEVFNYLRIPSRERQRMSREAFDNYNNNVFPRKP